MPLNDTFIDFKEPSRSNHAFHSQDTKHLSLNYCVVHLEMIGMALNHQCSDQRTQTLLFTMMSIVLPAVKLIKGNFFCIYQRTWSVEVYSIQYKVKHYFFFFNFPII